ncbi:MAG: rod shape-determining protein MreC [Flavobacteriales bacterium]|nr:rod shape-determining protein MreC [Flavobacteriales bacterium]
MRRMVSYIIENSNQLLFFLLLGFSIVITIQHHSYYRSQLVGSVNDVNGDIAQEIYRFRKYLYLRKENQILHRDNLYLKKQLLNPKTTQGFSSILKEDEKVQYEVFSCDVIRNSFNSYRNFLLLNIGSNKGIKPDMGVFNSKGVIGVVERVSDNYSSATSVLHSKTEINAIVQGTNHFGTLKWDGADYRFMQLIDVPSVAQIAVGDQIVTGGMSAIFPPNIPIGVIAEIKKEVNSNYYIIQVKLHNDMTNLGHAYVIHNIHQKEILQLQQETEK